MESSRPLERSIGGAGAERSPPGHSRDEGPLDRADGLAHGPPPVPSLAIRRMRLEQVLDDHSDRQVVLVRGPAGSGKTVLVAQWARARSNPCAWLSIDATHNDPNRLVWHLVEAVEWLSPGAPDAVVTGSPTAGLDASALRDLLDLVSHDLGTKITLVLDDVHRLSDEAARQVLIQLVERPPEATRVVLVSRSKPRLGLERARLRGDLVEVLPAMLRFQRDEIKELTESWTGFEGDVAGLEQLTSGWAAGLRLAQLEAAPDGGPFTGLGELGGIAWEYVLEELLDTNHQDLRSFLESTCWLPMLTDPLCAAVIAHDGGPLPFAWSTVEALPILPVASRPGTFRYPPILTRAMQREHSHRDPQAANAARRRAAEACRRAGELVTSIELFLQAGCADEAAGACAELAARGEVSLRVVDELLHKLPEVTPAGPRWLAWRIRAAVAAGHVAEGYQLLEQADHVADSMDQPEEAKGRDLVVARAALAERVGDVATLLACADRLLTAGVAAQDLPMSDREVLTAHGWRVRALVWSGDADGARAAIQAMEQTGGGAAPEAAFDLAVARTWIAWLDGDITGGSKIVTLASGVERHDVERAPELALLAGSIHRERNQPVKALPLLRQAHTLAAACSQYVVEALAASELARSKLAAGAVMDALELVVSTRASHPHLPSAIDVHLRSTEVRVRLERQDLSEAHVVLREAPPLVETRLLAARIALHEVPAQARELLEAVDPQTPRQAVEKLLLHAQVPDLHQADAAAALIAAISAGGHLGLVRTFLDEGPTVSRRLQQLALESPGRTLGRLAALVSHELALAPPRGSAGLVEQLTPRELAVLRMLPLRMSNREMAAQMYVSVNTMKTHIRAIYRKLDAPHRSAAVRRAKALQLV